MLAKVFLFVILAVTISCEAKKIKFVPSHPYIYNLELAFREDKINEYIVDSFLATAGSESDKLLHCDITLTDLIKAIPIKKLGVSDFNNAYKELNLAHDDDDLNNIISGLNYAKLKEVGISVEKIYKSVSKTYFKDRPADLLEALRILGIAEEFSVAYTFGNDEDIFNALQNGNFSYYNLVEIGNLIEGRITLKELFNVLGLKKLDEDVLASLINNQVASILVERGLTKDNLKNFLQALGLSVSNYKESKSFKSCYNLLTQSKSVAVAVSNDELITNDDSIVLKYLNLEPYASLTAKVVQGDGIAYTILSKNINNDEVNNLIRIKINGLLPSFISEASTGADVSNQPCQYVSVYGDQPFVHAINANFANDQLTVAKSFNVPFKKGSPLICGEKLYGLASVNNFNSIIFDYVQQKQQEDTSLLPVFPPIENKPEAIQAIKDFFEKIHANFNPCKYFDCGVKEDAEPCPDDSNTSEGIENNSDDKQVSGEDSSDAVTDGSGELEASTKSVDDADSSGDENESEDQNISEGQIEDQNVSDSPESSGEPKSDSAESKEDLESSTDEPSDNADVHSASDEIVADGSGSNDVDEESNNNNNSSSLEEASSNSEQDIENIPSNSEQNIDEQAANSEESVNQVISSSEESVDEAVSNSEQEQSNDQSSSGESVQQESNSSSNLEPEGNSVSNNSSNKSSENSSVDNSASDSFPSGNNDDNSSDNVNSP